MAPKDKNETVIGKAPQGQVIAETPLYSAPGAPRQYLGKYGEWLGDPDRRYGRFITKRAIPNHTKVEMLGDPILGMCQGYVSATLAQANRVIECTDKDKRLFFEAMFQAWEKEFYLQAAMAVALGSCGLIKKFAFQRPKPKELDAPPVWNATADPLIITGFDQVYPIGASPRFDNKNRHFRGMDTNDGVIDPYYSLWITANITWAFGSYLGWGRLRFAYSDWWMKHFGRDQFLINIQKNVDRITEVSYPPGTTQGGTDHRDIALEIGDSARSGATIAVPSSVWEQTDQITGENKLTGIRKWALKFLEGSGAVGAFNEMDDHFDSKMAIGYLVPPQMFMYVRQSSLGGPTTADVLSDLAEDLLFQNATEIDGHLNKYVFPVIGRANFPADSPPVRVRTVGLEPGEKAELKEIVVKLFERQGIDPTAYFDLSEAVRRLGYPQPVVKLDEDGNPIGEKPEGEEEPGEEEGPEGEGEPESLTASADEPLSEEERQRLMGIVQTELPPVNNRIETPSESEIRRVMHRLKSVFPEVFQDA